MEKLYIKNETKKENNVIYKEDLYNDIDKITIKYEELNTPEKKEEFINNLKYIEKFLWQDFVKTIIEKNYKWSKLDINVNEINNLINELKNLETEEKKEKENVIKEIKDELNQLRQI